MLDVNWLTPAKRRQLTVVGEEGMFELDYLTQRLTFTRAVAGGPQLISGYAPTFAGDVAELPVDNAEPLAAELDAFLRVVREGGRPVVDVEDGLWAVAIATSLLQAAAGGPIPPGSYVDVNADEIEKATHEALDREIAEVKGPAGVAVERFVAEGPAADVIVEASADAPASTPSHGPRRPGRVPRAPSGG